MECKIIVHSNRGDALYFILRNPRSGCNYSMEDEGLLLFQREVVLDFNEQQAWAFKFTVQLKINDEGNSTLSSFTLKEKKA